MKLAFFSIFAVLMWTSLTLAQPGFPSLPPGQRWIKIDANSADPEERRQGMLEIRSNLLQQAVLDLKGDSARALFVDLVAQPLQDTDVVEGNRMLYLSYRDASYLAASQYLDAAVVAYQAQPALAGQYPELWVTLLLDRADLEANYGGNLSTALASLDQVLVLSSPQVDAETRQLAMHNAAAVMRELGDLQGASARIDAMFGREDVLAVMDNSRRILERYEQARWHLEVGDRAEWVSRLHALWETYGTSTDVLVLRSAIAIAQSYPASYCRDRKRWSFNAYSKYAEIMGSFDRIPISDDPVGYQQMRTLEDYLLLLYVDSKECDAGLAAWAASQLSRPIGTSIAVLPQAGVPSSFGPPPYTLERSLSGASPSADPANPSRPLLNSELCSRVFGSCDNCLPERPNPAAFHFQSRTIKLAFDGPIKAETPGTIPVSVFIEDAAGQVTTVNDYANSMAFEIVDDPTGIEKSVLVLRGLNQVTLIPGVYHVRPKVTGTDRLLCDQLPAGWGVTPVYWTQQSDDFVFTLHGDCNLNGVDDEVDLAANAGDDIYEPFGLPDCCNVPLCDPDVNQDGNTDQGDIDYLVGVVAGQPNTSGVDPDYNRDGNADQADIDALINSIAGNGCPYASCGF